MKQLPIFYVCLLRLVVLSFKIAFGALSVCQTCASHDGEDFQAAGNEICRRDGSSTFSHSSVSGISPSLTLVAEAATSVKRSPARGVTARLQPRGKLNAPERRIMVIFARQKQRDTGGRQEGTQTGEENCQDADKLGEAKLSRWKRYKTKKCTNFTKSVDPDRKGTDSSVKWPQLIFKNQDKHLHLSLRLQPYYIWFKVPRFQFVRVPITGSDVSQCKPRGLDITPPERVRCWLWGEAKNIKTFWSPFPTS